MRRMRDSLSDIFTIIDNERYEKLFIVVSKRARSDEYTKKVLDKLEKLYDASYYSNIQENTKIEQIAEGKNYINQLKPDLIIAIGGGSAIDLAKGISYFSNIDLTLPFNPQDLNKRVDRTIPITAIPTTTGTGSEATSFSVVYIQNKKYSIESNKILPKYVILDPLLSINLPKSISASSGLDALSQSVESYWAVQGTKESQKYAKESLSIIKDNILDSIVNRNLENTKAMMTASYYSGKAINISKTTAAHALSYPITTFFNIPHGNAVALTLGLLLEFNYFNTTSNKVKKDIESILNILSIKSIRDFKVFINNIIRAGGITKNLNHIKGDKDSHIKTILNYISIERLNNNPVPIDKPQACNLLQNIFE